MTNEDIERGFRLGIEAAAKHVQAHEDGGGWHNVLAWEIRALAPPDAPSTEQLPCPVCDDGIEGRCPRCGRAPEAA